MDDEWVRFLHGALPQMGMRWAGFRRVRRQVVRRIRQRADQLEFPGPDTYREYLQHHPDEWEVLDRLCRVTVSRFYRDRAVFQALEHKMLPELAELAAASGAGALSVWSAGCASGEEPYTLAILWKLALAESYPNLAMDILATDTDPELLLRAEVACYAGSSLRDLPPAWKKAGFDADGDHYRLRPRFRRRVRLLQHDVRDVPPDGPFQLLLCRNLAFTYYGEAVQRLVANRLRTVIAPRGVLVVGTHEIVPPESSFEPLAEVPGLYRAA